ncbi:uncharacterized protein Hap1MRO34_004637 isoform 3-T3 [Clarias gariepinus]
MTQASIRFFVMVLGNTMNSHKTFLDNLKIPTKLCEVSSVKDSDVIIAFVTIVSRADTDISAAMEKIPELDCIIFVQSGRRAQTTGEAEYDPSSRTAPTTDGLHHMYIALCG